MNLHNMVKGVIGAINPPLIATYQAAAGGTTSTSGVRTPVYAAPVDVQIQVQSLTYKDLMQVSGLNLTGERRAIYISGSWKGVSRPDARGGDLVTFPDGSLWLIAQVLEDWSSTDGWVKCCATRQMLPA